MPNSLDRKAFEAAYRKIYPATYPTITPNAFERDHDGYYIRTPIQEAWAWWQAGAAAEREACAKICESFGGELTKWPDAYEGATAETQFIRGIGDCISKPFAKAIRDRSAP